MGMQARFTLSWPPSSQNIWRDPSLSPVRASGLLSWGTLGDVVQSWLLVGFCSASGVHTKAASCLTGVHYWVLVGEASLSSQPPPLHGAHHPLACACLPHASLFTPAPSPRSYAPTWLVE